MAAAAGASALAGLPITHAGLSEWWQEVDTERHRMILRALDMRIVIFPPGRGVRLSTRRRCGSSGGSRDNRRVVRSAVQ